MSQFVSSVFCAIMYLNCINCTPQLIVSDHNSYERTTVSPPEVTTPPIWWNDSNWIPPIGPAIEEPSKFWFDAGQNHLEEQLKKNKINTNIAKNIIIVIGDGMSIATQTAARMYMGGEEKVLMFEKFPYTGLSRTYCVNHQVPDSACTASAILSGIKNNYQTLGVSAAVRLRNCTTFLNQTNHINTILKYAQDAGKSTGIVTNTRVTHATPAAAYAKTPDREWENDAQVPKECKVDDIAKQLVYGDVGKKINVILGGGAREFLPKTVITAQGSGYREDNKNLINEWLAERQKDGESRYVTNKVELSQVSENTTDYLLGIFNHSHMAYNLEKSAEQPSLPEMSLKALKILQRNKNGFILFIEAGIIDTAHHNNNAKKALDETIQLHKTIELLQEHVNTNDTLMIVTADHSHTMSIGGYPKRGNNILGMGDFSNEDKMPFFTLNYANGMGYFKHVDKNCTNQRLTPVGMVSNTNDFMFPAAIPLDSETHGGDDVGVFAIGPWAHLFTGSFEQNFIGHGMMYASCLGNGRHADNCPSVNKKNEGVPSLKVSRILFFIITVLGFLLKLY